MWHGDIEKLDDFRYKIPSRYKGSSGDLEMRTSGIIYADEKLMEHVKRDNAPEQVANVATIPGIVGSSMAMPDIHWGYGFPIGGVAATDENEGVISPGGVGFDINCGVRLVRTNMRVEDVRPHLKQLVNAIFDNVPSGLGSKGKVRLQGSQIDEVIEMGAKWAVDNGYGWEKDLEYLEERGMMKGADASVASQKAKARGSPQLGSLGAGNHFLEVQKVDRIFDEEAAKAMGIQEVGQIMTMIHTGSRGFGHQVCTDNLRDMERGVHKYGIKIPDKQLACVPVDSPEGKNYFTAMQGAANFAWTNRQMIVHWIRESYEQVFGRKAEDMDLSIVYDVAHNIAKLEEHQFEGQRRKVYVHRKGATRAFGPGRSELPMKYRDIGQPVLIPGDMGSASYVLVGTEKAMGETWGSTCHGAGRLMSRTKAKKMFRGNQVIDRLMDEGIYVRAQSLAVAAEEAPMVYKNVDDVVKVVDGAGISKLAVRLVPLGVVKG